MLTKATCDMCTTVTIVTCTGGRPEAFGLLRTYIMRQTYKNPIQWIVVDDCENALKPTEYFTYIRRKPYWKKGQNTLAANLLAAIPEIKGDYILFMEDDDWYAPDYIEQMVQRLQYNDIVGNNPAIYYNIKEKKYLFINNKNHASLSQTAICKNMLPLLTKICKENVNFIDVKLHRGSPSRYFLLKNGMHLGIKSMPGRKGIGVGHKLNLHNWYNDSNMNFLEEYIGKDCANYKDLKL